MGDSILGEDGRKRCPWGGLADAEYTRYHDEEWGVVLHGEHALYERMCLEAFQSGLSWLIILRKREGFRKAFAAFDPHVVAGYTDDDVQRLLGDAGIVRNRAKILAAIGNARLLADLEPGLDQLLWSFAPKKHRRPTRSGEVPATTPESVAMAKELKRRGFRFLGPTTCYALMQATGMVDDHLTDCWRSGARGEVSGR
jgi:DNA-3-methyladenine glycosylase I